MEFDIQPAVDWAGNIHFGLMDPTMCTFWCEATTIFIAFDVDDYGSHLTLNTNDDSDSCQTAWSTFPEQGVWYHCLVIYDAVAHTAYFKVVLQSNGQVVAEETLTGLGSLTGMDRLAWSGVCDMGYCGYSGEGLIDNVRLDYDGSPTPTDKTSWGSVKSLFR
jgi:hypothetical protein